MTVETFARVIYMIPLALATATGLHLVGVWELPQWLYFPIGFVGGYLLAWMEAASSDEKRPENKDQDSNPR